MSETPNKKKRLRNFSVDCNPPETTKSRIDYSKAQDFIYTNAFKVKNFQNSSRVKTKNLSTTFSSEAQDNNFELKKTINKQRSEITRLKTQVQYATKELEKATELNLSSDLNCLHKMMNTQKRLVEDMKDELNKKDQQIEDIKKKI